MSRTYIWAIIFQPFSNDFPPTMTRSLGDPQLPIKPIKEMPQLGEVRLWLIRPQLWKWHHMASPGTLFVETMWPGSIAIDSLDVG